MRFIAIASATLLAVAASVAASSPPNPVTTPAATTSDKEPRLAEGQATPITRLCVASKSPTKTPGSVPFKLGGYIVRETPGPVIPPAKEGAKGKPIYTVPFKGDAIRHAIQEGTDKTGVFTSAYKKQSPVTITFKASKKAPLAPGAKPITITKTATGCQGVYGDFVYDTTFIPAPPKTPAEKTSKPPTPALTPEQTKKREELRLQRGVVKLFRYASKATKDTTGTPYMTVEKYMITRNTKVASTADISARKVEMFAIAVIVQCARMNKWKLAKRSQHGDCKKVTAAATPVPVPTPAPVPNKR